MATKIYVMTLGKLSQRATFNAKQTCKVCGLKIKIGDVVVSKQASGTHRPIRHEECARKIGMID